MSANSENKKAVFSIIALAIFVPALVSWLFFRPKTGGDNSFDINILPLINACINSTVTVLLLIGYYFIKQGKTRQHRYSMTSAFALSFCFLISYVVYHSLKTENTPYGGEGILKAIYYFILLSHILLSISVVPLVLLTLYNAIKGKLEKHRKLAKWTLPIWLYVSVTGVLVYIMIAPYY